MRITDLTNMRQRTNESVYDFIQRFREVKSQCYSLNLSNGQLADLAFQGMLPAIKEKLAGQEFENLSQLVQRVSSFESHFQNLRKEKYQKGVANIETYDMYSDEEDEIEVDIVEWTWSKKQVTCPLLKSTEDKYDFDITKADKIFDFLLERGQLWLLANHKMPSVEEFKKKRYCKYYNATSHHTNDCSLSAPYSDNNCSRKAQF